MRGCKRLTWLFTALVLMISIVSPVLIAGADDPEIWEIVCYAENNTKIFYEWQNAVPDAALLVVEYSIGDEESWVSNADFPFEEYGGEFLYGRCMYDYLVIDKTLLSTETDYYFRLRYLEQVSNTIHVLIPYEEPKPIELEDAYTPAELLIFPVGSDLTGIELPNIVYCQHSSFLSTKCEVMWEDLSLVDVSKPGWLKIRGEVIPPDGYSAPPGFAAYYPVMLTQEGMEQELVEILNMRPFDKLLIVRKDDDIGDLSTSGQHDYFTDNYLTGQCTITWDFSGVDTSQTGRYPVYAETDLPICFTIPQNLVEVAVLESDFIDLSGYAVNFLNQIFCTWFYQIEDYENIRLQYSIDAGPWQDTQAEKNDSGAMRIYGDIDCAFNGTSLSVYYINLEYEEFLIRLVYNDEPSNVLCISLLDGEYVIRHIKGDRGGADQGPQKPPVIKQPAPRPDAGDDDEATPDNQPDTQPDNQLDTQPDNQLDTQPGTQPDTQLESQPESQEAENPNTQPPAPGAGSEDANPAEDLPAAEETGNQTATAEPEPVPQAVHVSGEGTTLQTAAGVSEDTLQSVDSDTVQDDVMMEYSTEDTLSISGLRLKEMLAADMGTVLFEKHGVSVELPADFLAGLEIGDRSRFTVRIEKGDNGFALEILLDELPLSALPPTAVYFPFALEAGAEEDNLACFNAQGQEISVAVYDSALQLVRVEIHATGSYTIAERAGSVLLVSAWAVDGNVKSAVLDEIDGKSAGWLIFAVAGIAAAICAFYVFLRRRRAAKAGSNG